MARVTTADKDERMPPKKALDQHEIDILKSWIESGAEWPRHWALEPVKKPAPPEVKNADQIANDIDRFVVARLEKENLVPSPKADRRTLIRRLSLDLTGLLPTPEEVENFVNDKNEDAYAKVVDRLLASPHYGERWARHWLDEAR